MSKNDDMKTNKIKSLYENNKKEYFISEFESLLQACSNATGERAPLNHIEVAGDYVVYLSRLTKLSGNNGH